MLRCLIPCYHRFPTDTSPTELYPLSLHDALPIWRLLRMHRPARVFDDVAVPHPDRPARNRGDVGVVRDHDHSRAEVMRSEEHTSELQSRGHLVCRLLLAKKKTKV